MVEHRRSARIQARLWVQVLGVETEPVLRRGDVSLGGLFFETDADLGEPGTVQTLSIAPFSKEQPLELMARVVRVVTMTDIWHGPGIAGVGLEFMAEGLQKREAIHSLVHRVVGTRVLKKGETAADYLQSGGQPHHGPGMTLEKIDKGAMRLETTWPVLVGETIRCEIQAPASGRRLRIDGRAVTVVPINPGETRFRVEVEFNDTKSKRPAPEEVQVEGASLDEAMSVLLEETTVPDRSINEAVRQDLTGSLDRIQMPGLLSFIEMERMTGMLQMSRGPREAQLFIRSGQVMDVESNSMRGEPMQMLSELFDWHDGEFHFSVRDIGGADRVQMSTTALLMEFARIGDEAAR